MTFEFERELTSWRGPAPFVFVSVPADLCGEISLVAKRLSYGWGVIPVTVCLGSTTFTTSLFPRDGGYLVPVKLAVQRSERVAVGDVVFVRLEMGAE